MTAATPDAQDEFSFLPGQAHDLGLTAPRVERLSLPLPDGREVSALRYGGENPDAVFLHGAGLNAHTWDTTVLRLGRPALAIDLPGHGDSSWRDDLDYRPRTLGADIIAAMDAWTGSSQVLVGQSLGGLTAAAVAAARPDLVRAAIIVDITPEITAETGPAALREFFAGPADFASRDELTDRAIAFGLGGSREDTARGVFFNTRVRPDGRVEWKHHFARLAATAFSSGADSSARVPTAPEEGWDDLEAVRAPLILVRALRGFVSEADADVFQRHLPDARIVTVDAPHNVQETASAALSSLVTDAIDDAGRA